MRASRPTNARAVAAVRFGRSFSVVCIVGEGHGPPGDLPVPQGSRGDASIVPYRGCNNAGFAPSRSAGHPRKVCRGGACPSRNPTPPQTPAGGPWSSPTDRGGHYAVPVRPEAQNLFVGAGFIPPGVFVPPQGSRAHNVRPYTGYAPGFGLRLAAGFSLGP